MTTVTKLITRSFSSYTMNERIRKDLGAKAKSTRGGHNEVKTTYRGKRDGIDFTITTTATRHMGTFTELHVEREDFGSMAALVRFYRDIKDVILYNYSPNSRGSW